MPAADNWDILLGYVPLSVFPIHMPFWDHWQYSRRHFMDIYSRKAAFLDFILKNPTCLISTLHPTASQSFQGTIWNGPFQFLVSILLSLFRQKSQSFWPVATLRSLRSTLHCCVLSTIPELLCWSVSRTFNLLCLLRACPSIISHCSTSQFRIWPTITYVSLWACAS